MIKLYKTQ